MNHMVTLVQDFFIKYDNMVVRISFIYYRVKEARVYG